MATPVVVPEARTAADEPRAGRAAYARVAAVGLLLAACAPAVMLTAALLAGMALGEEGPFFGVMVAAPAVGAALAWRFGWWSKVLAILLAGGLAFMLFWVVFGLAYPASLADFLPGVLLPVGVLLAVVGSVAALVAGRRGHRTVRPTAGERRTLVVALAVVGLAVVTSGVLTTLARSSADVPEDAVAVTMSDFAFSEGTYEVAAGEPTTVRVENQDAFVHTFTIPELGIDETVLPGTEVALEIDAPAGEYTLYCRPHSDVTEPDPEEAGMAGTVVAR